MRFRRYGLTVLLFTCIAVSAGCVQVMDRFVGENYLNRERFEDGALHFEQLHAQNPDDPMVNYYLGRFLLARDEFEAARPYFERAVELRPDDADYHFWLGVNYWALGEFDLEREEYMRAVALDGRHLPANLYLGHAALDRSEWAEALSRYDAVLVVDAYEPGALYNRGEALLGMGRDHEAREAFEKFVNEYPDGSLARKAADRLNALGNFDYRNFLFGIRVVTLRSIEFYPDSTRIKPDSKPSLDVIGSVMGVLRDLRLHVVVYVDGDEALAGQRARAVREYVTRMYRDVAPDRLVLSWFGVAEQVRANGGVFEREESVNFITQAEPPAGRGGI